MKENIVITGPEKHILIMKPKRRAECACIHKYHIIFRNIPVEEQLEMRIEIHKYQYKEVVQGGGCIL